MISRKSGFLLDMFHLGHGAKQIDTPRAYLNAFVALAQFLFFTKNASILQLKKRLNGELFNRMH